jgi:site-specific DNA-adenine methylase
VVDPYVVPTFFYPGGKARFAPWIVGMMSHAGGVYVEPFAGRGNVFFQAALTRHFRAWHLNDIQTWRFFMALKGYDGQPVPISSSDNYYKYWDLFKKGDPFAIVLEPFLTYAGSGYGLGPCNDALDPEIYRYKLLNARDSLVRTNTTISGLGWEYVLNDLGPNDFVYFDPPYQGTTQRAYNEFNIPPIDYHKLISVLLAAPFKWILSEYPNDFYLNSLGAPKGYREVHSGVSSQKNIHQGRLECVWRNY